MARPLVALVWPTLPVAFVKRHNRYVKAHEKNLYLVLFFIVTFGLIQVYSSSYIFAVDKYGDGLLFFRKQLLFVLLGLGLFYGTSRIPTSWLTRWGWLPWFVATIGLILTFVPGIGVRVGGAQRWIPLAFGFRFEPCELMKVSLPLLCGYFYSKPADQWGAWTIPLRMLILLVPIFSLL